MIQFGDREVSQILHGQLVTQLVSVVMTLQSDPHPTVLRMLALLRCLIG